jgi:hypothetical protein
MYPRIIPQESVMCAAQIGLETGSISIVEGGKGHTVKAHSVYGTGLSPPFTSRCAVIELPYPVHAALLAVFRMILFLYTDTLCKHSGPEYLQTHAFECIFYKYVVLLYATSGVHMLYT